MIYALYRGFKNGFIMAICTFLALLVGIYAGIHFSDAMAALLKDSWEIDSHYLPIIAFVVTFLVVGALVYFGGRALQKVVSVVKLTPINKVLGMAFSLIKVSYLLSIVCVFIAAMNEKTTLIPDSTMQESILFVPIKEITGKTIPKFKESLVYMDYWYQEEKDSTGMSVEEIVRTKQVADSLDVEIQSSREMRDLFEKISGKVL